MLDDLGANYLLGDVLGTGGMGVVYSATQRSLGRRVAVKIPHAALASDPFVIRRFRNEAIAGGRLDHRNIARVIDFGGHGGAPFLVMEYVAGAPLDKLVLAQGALELRVAVELSTQILAALAATHRAGIVHADLKSANVLVETLPGGALLPRLIDFGLARLGDEPPVDDDRRLSGTPEYLAPELIQGGPPTVASDIYAAGVVLYELLTGQTPFAGGASAEILGRHLNDAVVPPSMRRPELDLPEAIEAVVMRALAKAPSARFATAALFAEALRAAMPLGIAVPRIARGTVKSLFSTEATTRTWALDPPPLVRATSAVMAATSRLDAIRAAMTQAIAGGDGDEIVTSYLELVRALIDGRELATAAAELEHAVELLLPNAGTRRSAVWRLQLCLAAVYSGLGDPVRALGVARLGLADATRAGSSLGQDRAHELISRLARHKPCKP